MPLMQTITLPGNPGGVIFLCQFAGAIQQNCINCQIAPVFILFLNRAAYI